MPTPVITEVHTGTHHCWNCNFLDKIAWKCKCDDMPISKEDAPHQVCRTWTPEIDIKPTGSCSKCKNFMPAINICRIKDMVISDPATWTCGDKWESADKASADNINKQAQAEDQLKDAMNDIMQSGMKHGYLLEQLDTVVDIACHHVPAGWKRWMTMKADIRKTLIDHWAKEDAKSIKDAVENANKTK